MVHENAMHRNCVDCHKEINKEQGDPRGMKGPAPASCGKCHISGKKKALSPGSGAVQIPEGTDQALGQKLSPAGCLQSNTHGNT